MTAATPATAHLHHLQSVLHDKRDLAPDETKTAIEAMMSGQVPDETIMAFLTAWNEKGIRPDEVAAAAETLRAHARPFEHGLNRVMDTCGTGGDAKHTINASTLTAFIVAAAGVPVAKHGNRAVSGVCGSACLLESLGAVIDLGPRCARRCLESVNMAFLFAPLYHPALKHVASARRRMGMKTIFNLLGPLVHPGRVTHRLIGVYDEAWVEPFARILQKLGVSGGVVVCGDGGLDEVSLCGATRFVRFTRETWEEGVCRPEDFGFERAPIEALQISDKQSAVKAAEEILSGRPGPQADFVLLNAGFALWAAEEVDSAAEGIERARQLLAQGAALVRMKRFIETTQQLKRTASQPDGTD